MFDERVLKTLFKNTPIGYAYFEVSYDEFDIPNDFILVDFNYSFSQIIGASEEAIGKSLNKIHGDYNLIHEISYMMKSTILSKENGTFSQCFELSGKCFDIYLYLDNKDYKDGIIFQIIDRTKEEQLKNELIRQAEDLKYLNYHDKLTGLYNRTYFEEEMKRLDTDRNLPISIIMGDTNGLKLINDVFGHAAGDNLIKSTAEILTKSCRKEDVVARWGGDEFIILLPNTSSKSALDIINRIKSNFRTKKFDYDYLNISLGYSVKKYIDKPLSVVIKEAENNMYKSKSIEGQQIRKLIVDSMVNYLYEGNFELKHHIDRLKKYSREVGIIQNLSQEDMNKLELLCEIHDIGNVSLDKDILFKIGDLTYEDWEEIKKHPGVGYRIAKSIPELTHVANYVLYHHERWDGNGYPHNLKGEEIPLISRIFSVVDAFDAMTQDKQYRKAFSRESTIDYLKENAGRQFDPKIVDIFINCVLN